MIRGQVDGQETSGGERGENVCSLDVVAFAFVGGLVGRADAPQRRGGLVLGLPLLEGLRVDVDEDRLPSGEADDSSRRLGVATSRSATGCSRSA